MRTDLTFPIMEGRHHPAKTIPWELIKDHEVQAIRNHQQTLAKLALRGGLSRCEAVAVLEDRQWEPMDEIEADKRLTQLVETWSDGRGTALRRGAGL